MKKKLFTTLLVLSFFIPNTAWTTPFYTINNGLNWDLRPENTNGVVPVETTAIVSSKYNNLAIGFIGTHNLYVRTLVSISMDGTTENGGIATFLSDGYNNPIYWSTDIDEKFVHFTSHSADLFFTDFSRSVSDSVGSAHKTANAQGMFDIFEFFIPLGDHYVLAGVIDNVRSGGVLFAISDQPNIPNDVFRAAPEPGILALLVSGLFGFVYTRQKT